LSKLRIYKGEGIKKQRLLKPLNIDNIKIYRRDHDE